MIELDRLADRNLERRADDVVFAGGILIVEAEGIAGGVVDELEIGAAELAVGPGIAEIPGELFGHDLDRDRVGGRFVEVDAGPDLAAHDDEAEEQQRGGAGPDGFESVIAVGVAGAAAVVAKLDDDVTQRELRQKEDDPDDDQGAHELRVVGDAVRVDRRRKPPRFGGEKITDNGGQGPNDWERAASRISSTT